MPGTKLYLNLSSSFGDETWERFSLHIALSFYALHETVSSWTDEQADIGGGREVPEE
jgi:hypothetical protein